jgi:hypothetical protein
MPPGKTASGSMVAPHLVQVRLSAVIVVRLLVRLDLIGAPLVLDRAPAGTIPQLLGLNPLTLHASVPFLEVFS